jgi:beta-glucosidase-like glycosyl hydrolase/CubicO group peptidase (beta-lactamase class C family)
MRERGLLLLAALLFLMTPPGRAQKASRPRIPAPAGAEKWVESTLKKMTLEEKLGQLLFVFYFGGLTSTESDAYRELVRLVEQNHIGGLVLQTRGTPLGVERSQAYPAAALANQLQARAKVPLLVGADFERGTAMRVEEGTAFPHAMAVAAAGSPQDAYAMGRLTALEARALGVHWIFAPVADVNSNPENPIINTRSFGEDPGRVAEFVAAYVRGVEEHGALSTTKHFPGHGDTAVDSHTDLPIIRGERARLDAVELVPFRAAIAAGASSLMTGHLAVPAVEPDAEVPATLSGRVLADLLRRELGFDGLIVTDALDMGGVTSRYPPHEAAVRAVLAGADVLLVPPVTDAALAALREAVESGRLPVARVEESVRRILRAKARVGLDRQRAVDLEALNRVLRRPESLAAAQEMADRGVTLLRDEPKLLPLDATRRRRVLLIIAAGDPDPYPGEDLEREIRWRVDELQVVRTDTRFARVETVRLPPPESYDLAVAALIVRVTDRKGTVGLPDNQAALVNELLATGKPVVVVCLGNPYLVERFPAAKTWLGAFSTVDVAQRAAARALFGQAAIGGRMPVSVPGIAKAGDGLRVAADPMKLRAAWPEAEQRLAPVVALLERAVADGAFPGGVLAVGHRGELVVRAFGRQTYDAKSPAVAPETIYDVASLTKPVVTTTAVMMLAARRLELDAPLARYLPEWAAGPEPEARKRVTLRHLLLHASGLPKHREYFREATGKRAVLARVLTEPLVAEPSAQVEYSDLGFILLGEVVERVTGRPLDAFARERIFAPLGMDSAFFNPAKNLRARIAPTEQDAFRKRLLHGEADDANAFAMGGVAGHAGLFATAADLAAFSQMLLNGGLYAHQRLLRRSTIEQFTARQTVGGAARALGWDVPTEPSSAGRYFSARSFGHNGFTGTSLWVDPEKDLFVILLTNRVHPSPANDKIRAVRPAVHDAVVEALGLAPEKAAAR